MVIFSTSTHANQPPEIPENTQIITAPEVRSMIADKEIYFIHVLSSIEYKIQHIPGSINIPVDSVRHSDKMPANKSAKIAPNTPATWQIAPNVAVWLPSISLVLPNTHAIAELNKYAPRIDNSKYSLNQLSGTIYVYLITMPGHPSNKARR